MLYSNFGHSTFHSGTVKVEKRMSDRYQALVSYTLSKAEDNSFVSSLSDQYGYVKVKRPGAADRDWIRTSH